MASAISTIMKGRAVLVPKTLGQSTMILRRSTQHHRFQEQMQLRMLVGPNRQHAIMTNRYFSSVATTANSADSDRYTDYKNVLAAILLLGATASTAVINNNSNNKTTCESAGSIVDIDEIPEYTAEEVAKNNGKDGKPVWMTYSGTVYNVTSFVRNHPGGMERILLAAGGPVEAHWHLYRQHFSSDLPMTLLEPLAVGTLREIDQDAVDDMMEQMMENEKDPYEDEPERLGVPVGPKARSKTVLKVHSDAPMNAEVPEHILTRSYLTPNHLYYMRHHHPVPLLSKEQIENYRLEIDLSEYGKGKSRISLKDLKSMPKVEVTMTMQCSGNRRSGFNVFEKTSGTTWGQGAISTAKWGGVRLKDLLKNAGMGDPIEAQDKGEIEHVRFQSIDGMSVSIGIEKATNPYGDVMICYEMNDEELPRDHGFPLRVIVPGYAAVRSTKWLNKISISKEEAEGKQKISCFYLSSEPPSYHDNSDLFFLLFFSLSLSLSRHSIQTNYLLFSSQRYVILVFFFIQGPFQRGLNYKILPPSVKDANDVNIDEMPSCNELSVSSGITKVKPLGSHNDDVPPGDIVIMKVSGWAFAGGGRNIVRVDVTGDLDKHNWTSANLKEGNDQRYGRGWAWTFWEAEVPARVQSDGCVHLYCKGVDMAFNSQPETAVNQWNVRGLMNNSWYHKTSMINVERKDSNR